MSTAQTGSEVTIHYTGTLEDGTVVDTSTDKEPVTFVIGENKVFPVVENALVGMSAGDKKNLAIPPEEGFGEYREDMIVKVPENELPEGVEVGAVLRSTTPDGQTALLSVIDIADGNATLDGNHPLAGKTLNFEVELVNVA
ncbi:FKBP-type peptidyl-prolyl cis-trans isomerase [Oceanidesulfovibrio indonesiensis]|nr:peptidylprolyl isomerase [Oceanidesulfovibrio indonesiensis]